MRKSTDNPAGVPAPAGRYSHVNRIDFGDSALLFLSGQVPVGEDNDIVGSGDMAAQTERVFQLIGAILEAQGASFSDVVNIRTYLTDISRLSEYASVRRRYIDTHEPPTSTTVEVSALFKPEAMVEVEVTAVVHGREATLD